MSQDARERCSPPPIYGLGAFPPPQTFTVLTGRHTTSDRSQNKKNWMYRFPLLIMFRCNHSKSVWRKLDIWMNAITDVIRVCMKSASARMINEPQMRLSPCTLDTYNRSLPLNRLRFWHLLKKTINPFAITDSSIVKNLEQRNGRYFCISPNALAFAANDVKLTEHCLDRNLVQRL